MKYKPYEAGQTVFKQGDEGNMFFIILKGKIQLSIPDPYGGDIVEPKVVVETKDTIETEEDAKGLDLTIE